MSHVTSTAAPTRHHWIDRLFHFDGVHQLVQTRLVVQSFVSEQIASNLILVQRKVLVAKNLLFAARVGLHLVGARDHRFVEIAEDARVFEWHRRATGGAVVKCEKILDWQQRVLEERIKREVKAGSYTAQTTQCTPG